MSLKLQKKIIPGIPVIVGAADIPKGSVVKLSSSVAIVTTSNEAFVGINDEIGYIGKELLLCGVGSVIWCLAHDSSITEGEWVVPAASGRVDGIAATTTAIQYTVGIALMDADAQDHLIPVLFLPGIVVGTQTV